MIVSTHALQPTGEKISHMSRSDIVRAGATPEFVTLCKTLYGDLIDPDEIWHDVIKNSPDQADVHAQGSLDKKRLAVRGAAITGGVLGGALGVREGYRGGKTALAARKAGQAISGKAKGQLALSGVLGVTDSIDLGTLATETPRRHQLQSTGRQVGEKSASLVSKEGMLPFFGDVVAGARKATERIVGKLKPTGDQIPKIPHAGEGQGALPGMNGSELPNTNTLANKVGAAAGSAKDSVKTAFSPGNRKNTAIGGATALTAAAGAKKAAGTISGGNNNYNTIKSADDVTWQGTFSKFDSDKHLAFGWASVSKVNGLPVIDKQGDYIDPSDLEDAAYEYVLKSRVGGAMHKRDADDRPVKVADIVESMVFTDDKVAKMGLPEDFNRGWWIGMKIHDPEEWSLVRKGDRTGFSIHGKGIRKDQDEDQLMGY
jgi:hypothetical protein